MKVGRTAVEDFNKVAPGSGIPKKEVREGQSANAQVNWGKGLRIC